MKRKRIGWFLCFMCLFSSLCIACSNDFNHKRTLTIIGFVTDSKTNWPLEGVNVELHDSWGSKNTILSSTITQKNGRFQLEATSSKGWTGDYYISLQKTGYCNESKAIEVKTFDEVQEFEISISMTQE